MDRNAFRTIEEGNRDMEGLVLKENVDPTFLAIYCTLKGEEKYIPDLVRLGAKCDRRISSIINDKYAYVQALVQQGKDMETTLADALRNNDEEMTQAIMKYIGDVTPILQKSISRGDVSVSQFLLNCDRPIDLNRCLTTAASVGNISVTTLLLDRGADPSCALAIAASKKNIELAKLLVDRGAKLVFEVVQLLAQ